MDLTTTSTTYGADSKEWLGSEHGTDNCDSVTLDATTTLVVFTDGKVPSGVVLGKITAGGKYGPYDNAAVDGRTVAAGFLFNEVKVTAGQNSHAAILLHGHIREAKLPASHGLDANAKTDFGSRFVFSDV